MSGTIICYGDSNTYGYNPENGFRYEYEERWTTILQKELKDSAIVIPEGLNGRTTSFEDELRPGRNGATYLDPCLHSHGPIDLVVLSPDKRPDGIRCIAYLTPFALIV